MMEEYEHNEEIDKFLIKIKKKMDDNSELKEEIETMLHRLCEIFETNVDLSLRFDLNVEDYRDEVLKYEDDEFSLAEDDTMYVNELIKLLGDEENLHISIDPIYLKEGINDIKNMLITTYENKIILVPIIENKK